MSSRVTRVRAPRVLVVDDFSEVVTMFADALRQSGMHVIGAGDGRAALAKIRDAVPAVIVSDIEMPQMDGLELCRELRRDPRTRDVPIVIVTAGDATQAQAAIEAGCDRVLAKPCSPALLVATVQSLIDPGLGDPSSSGDQ